jgi:hypothetical protein
MAQNMSISGGLAAGVEKGDIIDIEAPEIHPSTPGVYYREKWGLAARVDPSVTFEEYTHWAKVERDLEIEADNKYKEKRGKWSFQSLLKDRFSKGIHHEAKKEAAANAEAAEKSGITTFGSSDDESRGVVHDEEWRIAARALRTSGWGTVFYLITTDILGWGSTP